MKNKIKILRIINTLNPQYGGPTNTIIQNSIQLIKKGFNVDILTNDPINSNYLKVNKKVKIINLGPAIGNFGFNLKQIIWLYKNKNNYDKFILHGLWDFKNILARLFLQKKYFVFTHGQLDPYFSKEYLKMLKKKIYWFLFEKRNLLKANSLLLTSENEKKSLSNTFVNTNGIKKTVVNYGITFPKYDSKKGLILFKKKFKKIENKPFLIYLGRFHKKKGCEILLKAAEKIIRNNKNIYFLLAGPNNTYKDVLKKIACKLLINNKIIWSDAISGNLKWATLKKSQGMVLPSHGENFGVSLIEALLMKKPVITTNKVNIYNKIKIFKAGVITKNNVNSFAAGINKYLTLSNNQKKKMKQQAYKCYRCYFNLQNLDSYVSILKND